MRIGVLALQGAVREHIDLLQRIGVTGVPVKVVNELAGLDGLIIPGGESTMMGKLIQEYGFIESIVQLHASGRPIWGTCAGLILLATEIEDSTTTHLALLDVRVQRNAFGRQRDSFEAALDVDDIGDPFPAIFIRAPYIRSIGSGVRILARVQDRIVAVRQGSLLGVSFHPELTTDTRFHAYFVKMVRESMNLIGNN